MSTKTGKRSFDSAALLRSIIEETADTSGTDLLQTMVQKLAEFLQVPYVFIAEFHPDRHFARILAMWEIDHPGPQGEFDLAGTPCETVVAGRKQIYSHEVRYQFPKEHWLMDIGAEGYIATPLINTEGIVMGHLAVIDVEPIEWDENELQVFDIFAIRATIEMDRLRVRAELQRSEQWLETILSSVMDAVIVFDPARQIKLFNDSAARIFQMTQTEASLRLLDCLLTAPLQSAITKFISTTSDNVPTDRQTFLPEGLAAIRKNGNEFIVDATLSTLNLDGRTHYILILRDVDERSRAQAMIHALQTQTSTLKQVMDAELHAHDVIIGSRVMDDLLQKVKQVAGTQSGVLLLGETGTGKELIAKTIHKLSPRADNVLVKLNCAAMPADLIESELFGHEKGAFTGANMQRKGRFELADGGTLFLDEVGELSPAGQAKLLRVLQEHEFERVGGTKSIKVDVRVIAATNRDLGEMVSSGKFRADLFYRLNVFPISIPPLRERLDDIPQLCKHFLAQLERKIGKRYTGISPDSLRKMYHYSWPGNVRELQNVIERAAILATSPILDIDNLIQLSEPLPAQKLPGTPATLNEVERDHIALALELVNWVVEGEHGAAALLGMNPSTLRYRMQKLGIQRPQRSAPRTLSAGNSASDFGVLQNSD